MKKLIIILQLMGFVFCAFSTAFDKYPIILVKDISVGKEEGQIGWQPAVAGGPPGPLCMAIDNNGYIYIPDRVNFRVNVYDNSLNYIKTIIEKEDKKAQFASHIKIDTQGNIIYSIGTELIKMDSKGNRIYSIKRQRKYEELFDRDNFFIIDDYLFFYNNKEIQYIDNEGKIQSTDKALQLIQDLTTSKQSNQTGLSKSVMNIDANQQLLNTIRNENKKLIISDNFYSNRIRENIDYFKQIKPIKNQIESEIVNSKSSAPLKNKDISIEDAYRLFGYDSEHNSYWGATEDTENDIIILAIIVLNKYGEPLAAFQYGERYKNRYKTDVYPTSISHKAIAPNGDVYFMVTSKEKYSFYKVARQW